MRSAERKWQVASGWWLVDEGNETTCFLFALCRVKRTNLDKQEIRRGDRPGRPRAVEDDRPYRDFAFLRRIP